MPGRDLWGSASGFRDRRVPNFDSVDPEIKPMSQDSFNVGTDYQLGRASVFSVNYIHNNLVRTIEDIGLLVNGDEVYLYANPGEGQATDALVSTTTAPFKVPKATRQYDALQFELTRRFANNWFLSGNYVWSRLYGNYAGTQNSDEIRTPAGGLFSPRTRSSWAAPSARAETPTGRGTWTNGCGMHTATWIRPGGWRRTDRISSRCMARTRSRSARRSVPIFLP
jgi:hypothetical protein